VTTESVTTVICTHNRLALLRRAVASIEAVAGLDGVSVDILVLANACSDGTVPWLMARSEAGKGMKGPALRFVEEPALGKAHALNRLRSLPTAELIAFVDDDHRVAQGYLGSLVAAARHYPDTGLFCGRILPDWDGREPAWVHDRGPYRLYPLPVPRFDLGQKPRSIGADGPWPGGGNLAVRRDVLQRVGSFHTGFGPVGHNLAGAEDLEWVRRALAQGERLRYVPQMVQYHYVDLDRFRLGYLMKKAFERSASMVRLNDQLLSNGPMPPFYMWAKVVDRVLKLFIFGRDAARRRFYAMRLAGALGELKGYRLRRRDGRFRNGGQAMPTADLGKPFRLALVSANDDDPSIDTRAP
jgi:GT2 family glycosyltransferase